MHKPLDGLLVVSLEQAVAAPYCSSRLADAGARVIKIERPEGDFARGYDKAAKGLSSYFVWLNRGKQSLVADIKRAGGRRAAAPYPGARGCVHPEPRAWCGCARGFRLAMSCATGISAADHGRHLGLRRHRRLRDDEGIRPAGAGGVRPGDDHRPSCRPGPGRRVRLRHRLRHGRARRRAGGADRARHHRSRQGSQGQPVRRHGGLDERSAAVLRGHRQGARSGSASRIPRSARTARSRPRTARWC